MRFLPTSSLLLASSLALAQTPAPSPTTAPPAAAKAAPPAAPAAAAKTAPAEKAAPAKAALPAKAKTEVTWWGHAAFVITTPAGTVIAVDPWLKNPNAPKDAKWPEKVDAILVSHGHFDHVGDTKELADKTGATVISNFEIVSLIGAKNGNGGNMGGTIAVKDDVKIHLVEAVHSSGFGDPSKGLQYGGSPMGFVIEIKGGPTIYHAGDTDAFTDMELIGKRYHPSIALLPIGGQFTMDPNGAALAAKMTGAKVVIPMHFGTFPALAGTPAQLTAAVKKGLTTTTVVEMKPGETKAF